MALQISKERMDQAMAMYEAGNKLNDIVRATGISHATISKNASQRGLTRNPIELPAEKIEQMKKLRDSGMSNMLISKEVGVCYDTVLKYLGKQKTACRSPYGSVVSYVTDEKPKQTAPVKKPVLVLKECVKTYSGKRFTYKTGINDRVRVTDNLQAPVNIDMTVAELECFITELIELYSAVSTISND